MKKLQRWSETGGPSDPDLRRALIDARRGPSAPELAGLSAAVAARLAARSGDPVALERPDHVGRIKRTWRWPLVLLGVTMLGAIAWSRSPRNDARRADEARRMPVPEAAAPPPQPAEDRAQLARHAQGTSVEPEDKRSALRSSPVSRAKARAERGAPRVRAKGRVVQEQEADELGLLQAAQRALVVEPARSLSLAQRHLERFPQGLFSEEREAIRIEALFRLQRGEEARQQRALFDARYPHSTYRERLGRL